MVNQIYPPELQLNKANTSDTETSFLNFHLSFSNGPKLMINTINFLYWMAMFHVSPLMECIFLNSKKLPRVCSYVEDFMLVIKASLLNFSNRVIGIISLERLFPRSIAATMNQFQNSMSD